MANLANLSELHQSWQRVRKFQRRAGFGGNDAVLVLAIAYSASELLREWDQFSECARPVQLWLLLSYTITLAFRGAHHLGRYCSRDGEDFLLFLRQRTTGSRYALYLTWFILLPLLLLWTGVGTSWLFEVRLNTPGCLPPASHFWYLCFWQALCYAWVGMHIVFLYQAARLERRTAQAEADLRAVATEDSVRRWGPMSLEVRGQGLALLEQGLGQRGPGGGLTPLQIAALPKSVVGASGAGGGTSQEECPVCLDAFDAGDAVRRLPGCGHGFHQSCIDMWLLRGACCPLCKADMRGALPEASSAE